VENGAPGFDAFHRLLRNLSGCCQICLSWIGSVAVSCYPGTLSAVASVASLRDVWQPHTAPQLSRGCASAALTSVCGTLTVARPTAWQRRHESVDGIYYSVVRPSAPATCGGAAATAARCHPRAEGAVAEADWLAATGGLSRDLLMRAIANQLQEATLGGLLPRVKRKLAALAGNAENDPKGSALTPMARLKPGSKLVRTWHGQTHSVLVLDDGFEHQGRRYASLSQIAGAVTGVHWSGPRFFGLDRPQRQPAGSQSCSGSS